MMAARRGLQRAFAKDSVSWLSQFAVREGPVTSSQSQVWSPRHYALGIGMATTATIGAAASLDSQQSQLQKLSNFMRSPPGSALPFCSHVAEARATPHVMPGVVPDITLYQYEVCPFCCKVRAFLDYHKIAYEVVEVNPVTKGQLSWSKYKKVPVAKIGEEQINDSNVIITQLVEEMEAKSKRGWFRGKQVSSADHSYEEAKWRDWVDEKFVRLLTANIYRNWGESWETFEYITEHGNFGAVSRHAARIFGSATMWAVGRRMPKKYNIEGDLREALYQASNEWIEAVGKQNFQGGKKPNLADLAVFGVLRAVIGTKTFTDVMENTKLLPWFTRMADAVGDTSRVNPK